ncbi:hypothetical protein [Salegentibacter sp. BDJ18]|nr:hypothetical protein [Salegentibacter sp. BDJ18]
MNTNHPNEENPSIPTPDAEEMVNEANRPYVPFLDDKINEGLD